MVLFVFEAKKQNNRYKVLYVFEAKKQIIDMKMR